MKRSYLLSGLLALFVVLSCAKDNTMEKGVEIPDHQQKITGTTISMDSLRSLAISLPATFSETPQTRSTSKVIKEVVPMWKFMKLPATRSTVGENPLANVYVVNYANDQGFAILSADKRLVDVMAYSDNGNITDTLDNPGIKLFMQDMYDYADYTLNYLSTAQGQASVNGTLKAKNSNTVEEEPYHPPLDDEYYYYEVRQEEIGPWKGPEKLPLLTVKWGQGPFIYNDYVPVMCSDGWNAPAGCVATAMAQIMSYHSHPQTISLVNLDWSTLREKKEWWYFDAESTHRVATLFRRIGDLVQMKYQCGGSEARIDNANTAFKTNELGYDTDGVSSYSYTEVRNNLNNNRPVYVRGQEANSTSGHVWVVDGYKSQTVEVLQLAYWYRYEGGDTPHELWVVDTLSKETYSRDYVHCNWGWNGNNNGWFVDKFSNFQTNRPYDKEIGVDYSGNNYQFSVGLQMIKNIRKK